MEKSHPSRGQDDLDQGISPPFPRQYDLQQGTPTSEQTNTGENVTSPHTTYVVANKLLINDAEGKIYLYARLKCKITIQYLFDSAARTHLLKKAFQTRILQLTF